MKKASKDVIDISRFSGKFDLFDEIFMICNYTLDELRNNVEIYVGNNVEPIRINKISDLIPYYPYIIGSMCCNNKDKTSVIHLSSESYVDYDERDRLESYLKHILRIYNRCKRKKIDFDVNAAVKEIAYLDFNKEQITEIANRVKDNGKKAIIDNIHLQMHEYYRQILVDEMIRNNLNPADYGYERFIK